MEVMLDRVLHTNDHAGVVEYLQDSTPVTLLFNLLVETTDAAPSLDVCKPARSVLPFTVTFRVIFID